MDRLFIKIVSIFIFIFISINPNYQNMSHPHIIMREGFYRKAFTRDAYTRADGTHVPKTHIPAAYVPAIKITPLGSNMKDKRHLHDFGYGFHKIASVRRQSLEKAVKKEGYAYVIRRLNALRTLHKTTNPGYSKKADEDLHYVQKHHK